MLSDILYTFVIFIFVYYGFRNPFIALCGVLWVDTFKPQNLSYSFLSGLPFSIIFFLFLVLSMFFNFDKISKPRKIQAIVPLLLFMLWFTLTTVNAHFPADAWQKWDSTFKNFILIIIIPFVIRKRIHIEAFLSVFIVSVSFFTLSAGIKTILSGGGYGIVFTTSSEASGLLESSSLSMLAVMLIPILIYLWSHSRIFKDIKFKRLILLGLVISNISTVVGTYARTGLLSIAAMAIGVIYYSKRKIPIFVAISICTFFLLLSLPDTWKDRMTTIQTAHTEQSALGRILVWRWVIDYVSDRPIIGGGFKSYQANAGVLAEYEKSDETSLADHNSGKAFHSIYFEVLGEQGYVGLLIFFTILFGMWRSNNKIFKTLPSDNWKRELSKSLNISLMVFCVGGAFIGVAYQPWIYYLYAISYSIHNTDE